MGKELDVYGIGNAIIDLQYKVSEEDIEKFSLTKGGMKLVDQAEQKKLLDFFGPQNANCASGGSAANTMIAMAQLGGKAGYACLVAADTYGQFYLQEMQSLGIKLHVDPEQVQKERSVLNGTDTGTCVIMITPDAERTMNTHLGVTAHFGAEDVDEETLSAAKWLYVEGYLFASPTSCEAVTKALKLAKKHKVKVALTASDGFIIEAFGDSLREALKSTDLLFANLSEAQHLTGEKDEDAVFEKLKTLVPNVVMTLHERGARAFYDGEDYFYKPHKVTAVDETGAGDMFAGAFLYALTNGLGAERAGNLACFLASKVVAQLGPRLPGNVEALAKDQGLLQ